MVLDVINQNKLRISFVSAISTLAGVANIWLLVLVGHDIHQSTANLETIAYFAGVLLLMVAISLISQLSLSRLSARILYRLREDLVNGITCLPSEKIEAIGRHRLYAALTRDIPSIHDLLMALPTYVFNSTVAVSCVVYLATVSVRLFAVFVVFLVVGLSIAKFAIADRAEKRFQERRRVENDLFKCYEAVIDGNKELKFHQGREDKFVKGELKGHADKYRDTTMAAEFFLNLSSNWATALIFVGIGSLLFLSPRIGIVDKTVITTFVMVIFYLVGPLNVLLNSFRLIHGAKVGLRQLNTLELEKPPVVPATQVAVDPFRSMTVRQLSFRYPSPEEGRPGFNIGPLDLEIRRGEIVYFVGGNGSGKTTAAKLLTGLYEKHGGAILINGVELADQKTYFQYFSAVFQDYYLFETLIPKIGENADVEEVRKWVSRLGLVDKVSVEHGRLSTTKLSYGQRKRLALLVAYFDQSDIYVFDEWTADQDRDFRDFFYHQFLPELKQQGKTALVVTHDERYFHLADKVVKFESGSIVSITHSHEQPLPESTALRQALDA